MSDYAGVELGLPAEGAGSVAGLLPRVTALAVDGAVLLAVSLLEDQGQALAVGLALVVVNLLVLPVRWGTTLGHAALRLRLVPYVDGHVLWDQRGLTVSTAFGQLVGIWLCWPVGLIVWAVTFDGNRRNAIDRTTKTVVVEW